MNVSLARIHVIRERASEQKSLTTMGLQITGSFASLGAIQFAEAPV